MLLLHKGSLPASRCFASIVNAHSGEEVERLDLGLGSFDKVLHLNRLRLDDGGHSEQHVYLLVEVESGGTPRARLLPDTPQARSWFAENYHSLFFWLESHPPGSSLAGFGFYKFAAEAVMEGDAGTAVKVWGLD